MNANTKSATERPDKMSAMMQGEYRREANRGGDEGASEHLMDFEV